MGTMKKITAVILLLSVVLSFAACGGQVQKYSWGDYEFTVRYAKGTDNYDNKTVMLKLTFGSDGIPQSIFEENLENGKIILDGKEPSTVYLYQQNSNGRITTAEISFTMPKGYEVDLSKVTVTQ